MLRKDFYKKIAMVLVLIFVFVCGAQSNAFALNDGNIKDKEFKGDPKVQEAQQWLNNTYTGKYTYVPIKDDGTTGNSTVKALTIALQIELGIGSSSNGNFGPATAAKCPTISMNNPGSNSNIVRILQHALFCKGYGAYDDYGKFGSKTEKAVKELESDAGLDPTGVVTPMIFQAILNTDALKASFMHGDGVIRGIQQQLNKKYNKYFGIMPTDGVYSRSTNKALIYALQAEEGLTTSVANGTFGPTTLKLCPDIKYNDSRKNFVQLLEYVLYCNGFDPGDFTGFYGDSVKVAISKFQEFMCLNITGNADIRTHMSLYTSCGDPTRPAAACDTSTKLTAETIKTIKSEGYTHVGRYLTNAKTGNFDKKMNNEEVDLIIKSGLSIFPIYQTYGGETSYFTIDRAKTDADSAQKAAKNFGFPAGTTLYFGVDYDAYDYQVTEAIIPYFKQLNETMSTLDIKYNIGVYGPRNVCSRVYNEGYAKYCFVSDGSSGYSGNLGFPMPKQWSFDQFKTDITIGSGTGKIDIDKTAYSGRDKGVSSLDKQLTPVNEVYAMLEYLRHNQSFIVLSQTDPEMAKAAEQVKQESLYVMYTLLQNEIVKKNTYVTKYIATRLLQGTTFCYDDIKNIKASLMDGNSTANKYFAIWEKENEKERLSRAISLIPFIGSIKGFMDVVAREDIITGRKLTWWEGALDVVCAGLDASAAASLINACKAEVRAVGIGFELKTISKVGYSTDAEKIINTGKNAIKYAESKGVADANTLVEISDAVYEAVDIACKNGTTDLKQLDNIAIKVVQNMTRKSVRVLDEVKDATLISRVKELRGLLTSDYKKAGNFGYAKTSIEGLSKSEYYAHSAIHEFTGQLGERVPDISLRPVESEFKTLKVNPQQIIDGEGAWDRIVDTECKMLDEISKKLNGRNAKGTIELFTELPPCPSCDDVILQFLNKYPNIEIKVIHNNGGKLLP